MPVARSVSATQLDGGGGGGGGAVVLLAPKAHTLDRGRCMMMYVCDLLSLMC